MTKDLFSQQATEYSRFRPRYPSSLFRYLSSICQSHSLAWDCGTGNGQAALELASYFDQVIATDISEKQLSQASPHPKIKYQLGSSENSGISDQSVDLTTVAQAFHWFDHEKFYSEVKRISKAPSSLLAIWCYGFLKISKEIDSALYYYYSNIVGPFWEPERKLVEEGYRNVPFPFEEIKTPPFTMEHSWSLNTLLGYLKTWSATQTAFQKLKHDPIQEIKERLEKAWGNPTHQRNVKWELALRVGKIQ
jgi:ubiquinone/menaquinone biosynthesis C-methylase UbiE